MGVGGTRGKTFISQDCWKNTLVGMSRKYLGIFFKVLHTASAKNFIDSNFKHSRFLIFMSLDTICKLMGINSVN